METILPAPDRLELLQLRSTSREIVATVRVRSETALCPLCQRPAHRIHSHYQRRVTDLPWHGVALRLDLRVRRFFCEHPECARQIFAERFSGVVAPYARRTARLAQWFTVVGLALGGEAGARLLRALGLQTSPDALLAHLHTLPLPSHPTPRVIGVDDWSYRKGRTFGTILVDLERHRVIDLLPDREAATVKQWLVMHPGVEIVSRDRANGYADAIRQGAPTAIQIADRFHLLQNLWEVTEGFLMHRKGILRQALTSPRQDLIDAVPWLTGRSHASEAASQARYQRLIERYQQIQELAAQGVGPTGIAEALGISRTSVYAYQRMEQPPPRRRCPDTRLRPLAQFQEYLLRRWNEGIRNVAVKRDHL